MEFVTIVLFALVFGALIHIGEAALLSSVVITPAQTSVPDWVSQFIFWSDVVLASAVSASLLWWVLGTWGLRITRPGDSDKRIWWFILLIIPIVATLLALYMTEWPVAWGWLAYSCYILTGVGCYYISTALGSPAAVKFTPPMSCKLRKLWW